MLSEKPTAEKFDGVEMKRRIQEKIYEETGGMKPDEFLAYVHKQVQESRFATFFAGSSATTPTPRRSVFQPVAEPLQMGEAEAGYAVAVD